MLRFEQTNALKEPKESSFSNNPKGIKGKSQHKSAGRWTKEEHQRFVEGLTKFGKNWKSIEDYVGTRNGAQVRSHAQKYFNKLGKDGLPSFEGVNLQLAKKSEEIIRKTSGSSLDTNDSDQDHEDQGSESPIEEKLKGDLTNSNLVDKLSMSLATSEKPNVWENAALAQKKENTNDLHVANFSLFNLLMSKFKSCNNQVIMPKLSDIVQVSTGIENRIPELYSTSQNSLSSKFSFRLHQSNVAGNDQTPARNLDRLRTANCDDSSEQDLLVKKLKVN